AEEIGLALTTERSDISTIFLYPKQEVRDWGKESIILKKMLRTVSEINVISCSSIFRRCFVLKVNSNFDPGQVINRFNSKYNVRFGDDAPICKIRVRPKGCVNEVITEKMAEEWGRNF